MRTHLVEATLLLQEPPIDNDDIDFDFYDDKVWPIIANRVPSFENSKVAEIFEVFS